MNFVKTSSRPSNLRRLQFDMTQDQLDSLDRLTVECSLATRKELFNYAMTLLRWAVDETKRSEERRVGKEC